MLSVHKILSYRQKSEGGFVLIAALMAVMILMAVGFFILTTTSQDLRMSSRLVGERKAFSAAESGVQAVCLTFDPAMTALSNQPVDSTGDPNLKYSVATPTRYTGLPSISAVGADIVYGKQWIYQIYNTQITGTDQSYGSSATIAVGFQFGPVPDDPTYH